MSRTFLCTLNYNYTQHLVVFSLDVVLGCQDHDWSSLTLNVALIFVKLSESDGLFRFGG